MSGGIGMIKRLACFYAAVFDFKAVLIRVVAGGGGSASGTSSGSMGTYYGAGGGAGGSNAGMSSGGLST